MRKTGFLLLAVSLCLLVPEPVRAQAELQASPDSGPTDYTVPIRVRHFEGTVSVQRALASETSEALVNLPLEAGDRLWTDEQGRAELVLPDGGVVWVDQRTTLDIVSLDNAGGTILRLWGGAMMVRRPTDASSELRVDTAQAATQFSGAGLFRVEIDSEQRVWLFVYRGTGRMTAGGITDFVGAGEQTFAEPGTAPAEVASFNTAEQDEFGLWQGDRLAALAETERHVAERDYLPAEVAGSAADLETSGSWFYYADFGAYAWRPTVGVSIGWSPYRDGRWVYGYAGWTWVPYASWGWATTHYGRWHHLPAYGWSWFPGYAYSPASVSWYVGGGYVGWSPIGYWGYPFLSINLWFGGHYGYGYGYNGRHQYNYRPGYDYGYSRGKAVAGRGYTRGAPGADQGWSFVNSNELGRGGRLAVARSEVPRGGSTNSVSFDGPMRQRNPSTLVAQRSPARGSNAGRGTPTGGRQAMSRTEASRLSQRPSAGTLSGTATGRQPGVRPNSDQARRPAVARRPDGSSARRPVAVRRPTVGSSRRPSQGGDAQRPARAVSPRPTTSRRPVARPGSSGANVRPSQSSSRIRPGSTRPGQAAQRSPGRIVRPGTGTGRGTLGLPSRGSGSYRSPTIRPRGAIGAPSLGRPTSPSRGRSVTPRSPSRGAFSAPRGTPSRSRGISPRPSGSRPSGGRSGISRGSRGGGRPSGGAARGSSRGGARARGRGQ